MLKRKKKLKIFGGRKIELKEKVEKFGFKILGKAKALACHF